MTGSPLAAVAPGDVDLLVAVEVQASELELHVLDPDDRADLGVLDTGLLVELTGHGQRAVFPGVDPATGDLEPRRLRVVGGIAAVDEEDVLSAIEEHDPGRRALQRPHGWAH